MYLTGKETTLLEDLKSQEALCIEKYTKYAKEAHDPALSGLFRTIAATEEGHLQTVSKMLAGQSVSAETPPTAVSQSFHPERSACTETEKQEDGYLCRDALAMEKHVSSLYDTTIFEFSSPVLRDVLSHIQKEEQNHGEQLYEYLSTNGMYS